MVAKGRRLFLDNKLVLRETEALKPLGGIVVYWNFLRKIGFLQKARVILNDLKRPQE